MLATTHARPGRKKPVLAARHCVDRDLIDVIRNPVRVDRPPAVGAFIPQRHVNYFAHYLNVTNGAIPTIINLQTAIIV
jgi:hypothetical protein